MARQRVVILGGGAAGVLAAQALERRLGGSCELTLVARRPWGPVAPLLGALAAGNVDPRRGAAPLRPLVGSARLVVAEVAGLDAVSQKVQLAGAEVQAGLAPASLAYDHVVVALGAAVPPRASALPFSGITSALLVRERLVRALEAASAEDSPRKRRLLTTVLIVGGSTAACALAGEVLASLRREAGGWPRLGRDEPRVVLVAPDRLVPGAPAPLGARIASALTSLGVEVRTSTRLAHLADDHAMLEGAGPPERLDVRTVIDADAREAPACLGPIRGAGGRVAVSRTLASEAFRGLWALGACAAPAGEEGPATLDDLIVQADTLASHLAAAVSGASSVVTRRATLLRALALAPGVAVADLPLPPPLAFRLARARALARWWPSSSWIERWIDAAQPPGLLLSLAASPPPLLQTPAPPATLPLPTLPLPDLTAPGLPPFTLPIPTPPLRR